MNYFTKLFLATLLFSGLGGASLAQWEKKYVPSQHWPTFDVESYNGDLYATTNAGMFRSSDNGETWDSLSQMASGREIFFTGSGNILVRTNSGVVKSMDGGTTWEYDTAGIGIADIKAMFYDAGTNKMFIGLSYPHYGLFVKEPEGASWSEVTSTAFGNNFTPCR